MNESRLAQVRLLDYYKTPTKLYFVMELATGKDLFYGVMQVPCIYESFRVYKWVIQMPYLYESSRAGTAYYIWSVIES